MNRNVVVTGGSKGIGKACVEAFLRQNDTVVFCDLDESASAQCLNELMYLGKLYYFPCDISNYDSVKDFFLKVNKVLEHIDILVNNAGIQIVSDFASIDVEDWDRVIQTNVNGTFYCIKEVVHYMKSGSIVNMSSLYSSQTRLNKFSYDASKAAIKRMTEEFALALSPSIRVNAIEPGTVYTPMNQDFTNKSIEEKVLSRIPLNRIAQTSDIAKNVVYLCSEDANYITGISLIVDGGRHLV
jgi:NAD(P)-dependent dehydrogenase (short-subunit alcohol dehydrogenase family)